MVYPILTQKSGIRIAALALLILGIDCSTRAAAQMVITEQQLDSWVFRNDGNAVSARRRLDSQVSLHVEDIDRSCKLTPAQKTKLQLAGRGDIKHLFNEFDVIKRKFKPLNQNQPDFQEEYQRLWQMISPLQIKVQAGLFQRDSLFFKSIHNTLTSEQQASYKALEEERRRYRYRASVEQAVDNIEQTTPLRDDQRQKLIGTLLSETKPPPVSGQYDYYYLAWQMAKIPEDKLKPMFDGVQWKAVDRLRTQYRNMDAFLRQNGYFTTDQD
jgi:hypothetical protein